MAAYRVFMSSARRTHQTWDAVSEAMGDVEVHLSPALYNASSDVLRRAVEAAEDDAGCLLLVAHNPGVHQLAVEYLILRPWEARANRWRRDGD